MTQAPERIWAMLDRATVYMNGNNGLRAQDGPFASFSSGPATEYIRADLIPQWRPIGAWSKKMDGWFVFAKRIPNAMEWTRCDRAVATHFMQLTPPEAA